MHTYTVTSTEESLILLVNILDLNYYNTQNIFRIGRHFEY
jgi:hypothetical protein